LVFCVPRVTSGQLGSVEPLAASERKSFLFGGKLIALTSEGRQTRVLCINQSCVSVVICEISRGISASILPANERYVSAVRNRIWLGTVPVSPLFLKSICVSAVSSPISSGMLPSYPPQSLNSNRVTLLLLMTELLIAPQHGPQVPSGHDPSLG